MIEGIFRFSGCLDQPWRLGMPPAGYFLCRKESNQRRRLGLRAQTRGSRRRAAKAAPSDESRYQGASNSGAVLQSGTRFLREPNFADSRIPTGANKAAIGSIVCWDFPACGSPKGTATRYNLPSVRAGEVLRGGGLPRGSAHGAPAALARWGAEEQGSERSFPRSGKRS